MAPGKTLLRLKGKTRRPRRDRRTRVAATGVLFETFEPRVLLDAAVPVQVQSNAIGDVLASDTAPATVADGDGTSVTVSITGNGHWQLTQQAVAPALTITGTDGGSAISIVTAGGDGRFLFSGIDVEGPAASLTGTAVDLQGGLTLKGPINNLLLGDLTTEDTSVTTGANTTDAIAQLTVGETTLSTYTVNGGGTLSSGPTIIADQAGSSGSKVTVAGGGSLWQVNGGLTVGNADSGSLSIVSGGAAVLDTLLVGAQSSGDGQVTVNGVGTLLSVSGTATFGDHGSGNLQLQSGAVVTLHDALLGNVKDSLGQITLTGAGSTLNVVGTLTLGGAGSAVLTVGKGTTINLSGLNIGPGGVLNMIGGALGGYTPSVGPLLTAGLNSFGAGTATNGTTADPTVSGTVAAANTLVSLRAGLGAASAATFTDITKTISGGAFTLTPAQFTALNGGTLPDGRYVLHLIATDRFGIQTQVDVTVTLQTSSPAVTGFGLAQGSAVAGSTTVTSNALVSLTGATTPGAVVTLIGVPGAQTVANTSGVFQFANIPVATGDNAFTVQATNGLGLSGQAQTTITRQGIAGSDVAMQWNQVVLDTIAGMAMYPPDASRLLAIVSLAQYDTIAAIEGTSAYMVKASVSGPASEPAALAQAAYEVLVSLFPLRKPIYNAALAQSLTGLPTDAALTAGLALGNQIADTIVALRKDDGSADFVQYDGGLSPGQWSPTAPTYQPAIDAQWGAVTPFAIANADALVTQIGPPPALTSAEWAADLNQVESLGSATSATRTGDQTQIAQFWSGGTGTLTPVGIWNTIAHVVSQAQGLSLSANVRMFALLNTALADAAIADWDIKYTYGTWRPIQAIPIANTVNFAATSADGWTPLLVTPAFPEYASGHSTFSAAAADILASIFGDNTAFTFGVSNLPGITRGFTSFSQAAAEAGISRIYGGIHFQFSNLAGQDLGKLVADQVLARFALTQDTQPPSVITGSTPTVSKTNLTVSGQVVDALSGVAGATVSYDGGATKPLTLDATGHFSLTTPYRLEGNDDGAHTISIVATDIAGKVAAPFTLNFVLDTKVPVVSLASLNNGDDVSATSTVSGIVDPTGSSVVALSYALDGGVANPITFDPATGVYNQALAVRDLGIGQHTIVITATDAAGNVGTLSRTVNVAEMAAFTLSAVSPTEGQTEIGVTYRPRIQFSRAVNPATLTQASFFATDAGGNTVDATIAPASDGSYAWLLFKNQLPGAAEITLHIVGGAIRAATDGAFLDAAGSGDTNGSTQTITFTTVSTTGVPGTVIKGIVADPGPDLTPMTFDDTGRGADGVLSTPDDVYKLPIANAKVTILGLNITVFTDAQGRFEIDNAPAGDVKLAVDGRTATNAPAGFFFPEMVFDLNIKPGVVNTPMDAMGTTAEQAANAGILATYLPRVPSSSLKAVSDTQPTTISVDENASPNLTPEQRDELTVTVQPGSALDENGNVVSNVQLGISTVPTQLIQDMLPPGLTQYVQTITIQAPGVAVFTTPLQLTFPNVYDAPPGTKLNVLSFDHTTGRLVIDGTATVSADGKTVTTDPGAGVVAPGWHGVTPPGSPTDNDPKPPCDQKEIINAAIFAAMKAAFDCFSKLAFGGFFATANDVLKNVTDLVQRVGEIREGLQQAKEAADAGRPDDAKAFANRLNTVCGIVADVFNLATVEFDAELNEGLAFLNCATAIVNEVNDIVNAAVQKECITDNTGKVAAQILNFLATQMATVNSLIQDGKDNLAKAAVGAVCNEVAFFVNSLNQSSPGGQQPEAANGAVAVSASDQPTLDDLADQAIAAAQFTIDALNNTVLPLQTQMMQSPMPTYQDYQDVVGPIYQAIAGSAPGAFFEFQYGTNTFRGVADNAGGYSAFLPPSTAFTLNVYDPATDSYATYEGVSSPSGTPTKIPDLVFFPIAGLPQTGLGGLPDLVEEIIGGSLTKPDNLIPGIQDVVAVHQGIGETRTFINSTGVLATAALRGTAQAVDVQASTEVAGMVTAYVATGSQGLAIVDVSAPLAPIVRNELKLDGFASDVAADEARSLVAVASGASGLTIVDVDMHITPAVKYTVAFPSPVTAVTVSDGIAYVIEGTTVASVDLTTGQIRTTLDLSPFGGDILSDIAFDGATLFTMDASHTLRTIAVDGDVLTALGQLSLPAGGGKIFVGGTVVYVSASNGITGGYETVDVSDPANPALLAGVGTGGGEVSTAMALNGSGLAVSVGSLINARALDVLDVSDPNQTNKFVTRINLPQIPNDVAIANGIAFVADGAGGLNVVNYLGLDTKGVAPGVSIDVGASDVDPGTDGTQLIEGSVINVRPTVTDDVQVRDVALLVNGAVVESDVSYPFEFGTQVPAIATGGGTMTIQVRATDTGGNTTLSAPVVLNVVADTFPPQIARTSIADGASLFFVNSIDVTFSKPLDISKLAGSGIALVNVGADGVAGTADDVAVPVTFTTRSFGQVLTVLLTSPLNAGSYQLRLDPSVIADISGNALAAPLVLDFSVRPASDVQATSGVPAIDQNPSANAGQTIGIAVPFDPSTAHIVFDTIDASGLRSTRDVAAGQFDTATSRAFFLVPDDAITGDVTVYGLPGGTRTDFVDGTFTLQIVPNITSVTVDSVSFDGAIANVTIHGTGFIEGNNSQYNFGATTITDSSLSTGPDVFAGFPSYRADSSVSLTIPLIAGSFSPISVTTLGGTSTPLVLSPPTISGVALSGIPANPALPSANPGQAITLSGAGLSASTGVIVGYTANDGSARALLATPTSASADGTSATLIVPTSVNGIASLRVMGSAAALTLQIVPALTGYFVDNTNTLRLFGSGLREADASGATTYNFAGATVTDTAFNTGPDVYQAGGSDNSAVYLPAEPAHGFGSVTVTTTGGTSASLSLNELETADGYIRDIATDPAHPGQLWVADNGDPAKLHLIDSATGAEIRSITLTNGAGGTPNFGGTSFFGGIQVVPASFILNGASVPAGSLLLFYGPANPDSVIAVNAATGTIITSLTLTKNYDTTGGVYDPVTGDLFVIDRSVGPNRIVGIHPTGANAGQEDAAHSFTAPFNAGEGGLALDPSGDGTLWYGSDQSSDVVRLTSTGTVLKHLNIFAQTAGNLSVSGLAFDAAGNLLVGTTVGVVLKLNTGFDPAVTAPTLSAITGTAAGGTAANPAAASANTGQVITLTGTHFGPGTEVVFQTRDTTGTLATQAVTPLVVGAGGTSLQVQVPATASTGAVQVVNVATGNLGFNSGYPDAIYRGVTLRFTAGSSNALLTFADGGLEGLSNESWGLDNVAVRQGQTTLFADNFESGAANPAWSSATVDTTTSGVFSAFLGRFSGGGTTLSLSGLQTGQSYTLTFDLYAIDAWDGLNPSAGPDLFEVSADGTALLNVALSNFTSSAQTFNASAALPLQIVPTLTSMDAPAGGQSTFNLFGSGFQAGAMTITVGGVTLPNGQFTNQSGYQAIGSSNAQERIVSPLTLNGPVTVTTAGGSATLPGYVFPAQPPVQFSGITATAAAGIAVNGAARSANAGQTIVLHGQGFTSQTWILFAGQDATGANGTIARQGQASTDGTTLTLQVPVLAKTGAVQVLGSAASFQLQIVPVIRGVGGTVASGNTIELDASGLVPGEVTVTIDGRGVGAFSIRDTVDAASNGFSPDGAQQLLTLTVPAAIGPGVITVQTNGGIATLRTGIANTPQPAVVPNGDAGDTLATATAIALPENGRVDVPGNIGDGATGTLDVDFYQVPLAAGDLLTLSVSSAYSGYLRAFDPSGIEMALDNGTVIGGGQNAGPAVTASALGTTSQTISLVAAAAGNYRIGLSGLFNTNYDPAVAGSGDNIPFYTGDYTLNLERVAGSDSRLTGIDGLAGRGQAAITGVASANVGQVITLSGVGLRASDHVTFTTIDSLGDLGSDTVVPLSVAADGLSLTVAVPSDAVTGEVRLAQERVGLLLQVVPTLEHIDMAANGSYSGSYLALTGTGLVDGLTSVRFGGQTLVSSASDFANGINVFNGRAQVYVPDGVGGGPISVTTPGGTSTIFPLTLASISATPGSGAPANAAVAAANPGQAITIHGTGLELSSGIVFPTVNEFGTRGQIVVLPTSAAADGTSVVVVVPQSAVTGVVRVVGDSSATDVPLQIVPVVTGVFVNSVAFDGSSAQVTLRGSGFVEGDHSTYLLGSASLLDESAVEGPSVENARTTVTLTVPLVAGSFGPISVTALGGTSAPLVVALPSISSLASSGTPANPALPSANPGQAITLSGTGLSTSTGVIFGYTANDGTARTVLATPVSASADGTSATLIVPTSVNGIATLRLMGSAAGLTLQIVPTLTSYFIDNTNTLRLFGSGLREADAAGATTYNFAGGTVTDSNAGAGADVYQSGQTDNSAVYLPAEPAHGFGSMTVTTTGGTSASFSLNELETADGYIRDIATDPAHPGQLWVADNNDPAKVHLIDTATGAEIRSITITNGAGGTPNFGGTSFFGAIQVVPAGLTLGFTPVPAGSLLLFYGPPNPDTVIAVNGATGTIITSLSLTKNYDTTGGVYDPVTGDLFVIDRSVGPNRIVGIHPGGVNAGQEDAAHSFTAPFNAGEGALALDPSGDGSLWYGADQSNDVVRLSSTGTVLKHLSVTAQSAGNFGVSGLAFDTAGNLLVGTTLGVVLKLNPGFDPAVTAPTLSAIAGAAADGTAANPAAASANAGQVITLTGTHFGPGTEVVFQTRDATGTVTPQAVTPVSIGAGGSSLQVQVPATATTGAVQVVNVATGNLGFNGNYPDAIYRGVTLQFIAGSSTASLKFADGGLEGLGNESWGLDNVAVRQGQTTVFADDFETGAANAAWSTNGVDTSASGLFSNFLGRFSGGGTTLSLSGLNAGQSYTLSFDLYAIDSWDGATGTFGPDLFQVSADGTSLLNAALSNFTTGVQTFNTSAALPLQIVPTLAFMDAPAGGESTFNLFGSGFQAGAMTITVGGVTLANGQFANQFGYQVVGTGNAQERIVSTRTLSGPVMVTTAGGSATLPGYVFPAQPPVQFNGITASAAAGQALNGGVASANAGQTIVLHGQGFSNQTWVLFPGQDETGTDGVIARQGQVSTDRTTLTLQVPALAKTGAVQVLGSGASFQLQIVPVIRGAGGTVASGGTIELDASGLVPGEVTIQIDGQTATLASLINTVDASPNPFSFSIGTQQLATLVVPAGVTAGVITVTTAGGTMSLHTGVTITAQPAIPAGADTGDTTATAQQLTLPVDTSITASGAIGDNALGDLDVDFWAVSLNAGDRVGITLNSDFFSHIRVFDATNTEITAAAAYVSPGFATPVAQLIAPATGTYFIGVSSYTNASFDPAVAGSGEHTSYTGNYALTLERSGVGDTHLTGIGSTADSGQARVAGVAAANPGQTITINGIGLVSSDLVSFLTVDGLGVLHSQLFTPASVDPSGNSLTVVVPANAATGTVSLQRDGGGILLQIVPTLDKIDVNVFGGLYSGGFMTLTGKGYQQGLMSVNFGGTTLASTVRGSTTGINAFGNGSLQLTVPDGVETGPMSVSGPGGTSAVYPLTFSGIVSAALTGVAANAGQASANPGQIITLQGTHLDLTTEIVFATVDDSGIRRQVLLHPSTAAPDGTSATVTVPANAMTGVVRVVGDSGGNEVPLQIVPVLNQMTVTSVASDGSTAQITLTGIGFVDGNNSSYQFGSTTIQDAGGNQATDVFSNGTSANLTVPLSAGAIGPVTVTTPGGVSAPISTTLTLTLANAAAASGTPANPTLPSANPGQTITLTGTGLKTSTKIIFSYTPSNTSSQAFFLISPATAAADGTSATFVVPNFANGIASFWVFGAANPAVLQIVPVLTSAAVDGTGTLRLFGLGLQEGGSVNSVAYNFAGGVVTDTSVGVGVDVYNNNPDNSAAYLPAEPVHGFGAVTTTTAGGTSAPIALNELQTNDGYLRDLAMDPSNPGQLWVADNGNPAKLHLIDTATGADIRAITLTTGGGASTDFGSTAFFGGMQIAPATFSLNGASVPAGSLLLFDGQTNADRVIAVDPSSGLIIATLVLTKNYDLTGGVYDPSSGHLYIVDRSVGPNQIVAVDPADGTEIANSRFNLPVNAGEAGLALDPNGDGTFWYSSDQSNHVWHLAANGTVLKDDDLTGQGVTHNEINGLSFDNAGRLLVASALGVVYRVTA